MSAIKQNNGYNVQLEGLRGLCAIMVFIFHVLGFGTFGIDTVAGIKFIMRLQFANAPVLIFFIISGYVIGISHIHENLTLLNLKAYLKKRFIRLYPIYLFSLLLCVVLDPRSFSLPQIIGHLFFLQEFVVKTLNINGPLWSLGYEFFYYLLFIIIWAFNNRSKNIYPGIAFCVLCLSLIGHDNNCLRSFCIGWIFWLSGLYIARLPVNVSQVNYKPFLSYWLLLLATIQLDSGNFFLQVLHLSYDGFQRIIVRDMMYLPICLVLLLILTKRHFPYLRYLLVIAYGIPIMNIIGLLYLKHDIGSVENWIYGIAFLGVSVMLLKVNINSDYFKKLAGVGKISYAIYILHFPIVSFLNAYLARYLSGISLITTGLILTVALTYSLSYLIELRLQPRIKHFFS